MGREGTKELSLAAGLRGDNSFFLPNVCEKPNIMCRGEVEWTGCMLKSVHNVLGEGRLAKCVWKTEYNVPG